MHEDDGGASLQLVEDRIEPSIAEIDASVICEQDDPVGSEQVEGPRELVERAGDIRERERGEEPEAIGVVTHELRSEVVGVARHGSGLGVVAEMDTGRRHREHGGLDIVSVHQGDGSVGVPRRDR